MSSLAVQAQFEAALTPMGAELVGALAGDGWGVEAQVAFGELTLVAPREHIVEVMTALRDRFGFQQLLDVCGADYPDRSLSKSAGQAFTPIPIGQTTPVPPMPQ